MFLSLFTKGPRVVLAEKISEALNDYFIVDKDAVESSLLNDAQILLRNISLRRKHFRSSDSHNTVLAVEGIVDEVRFSWQWSFLSSSSSTDSTSSSSTYNQGMVQDARLAVNGLRVQIRLKQFDRIEEEEKALVIDVGHDKSSAQNETKTKGFMDYYIQQIVDHLTLQIEDFQFKFSLDSGSSIVMHGDAITLNTVNSAKVEKKDKTQHTILSQEIALRKLCFFMTEQIENDLLRYPLMESFDYSASVVRLSGQRFQGVSGLAVYGNLEEGAEVKFYLGPQQIKALCEMLVLLSPTRKNVPGACSIQHDKSCDDVDDKSVHHDDNATQFRLPLPNVTLVVHSSKDYIDTADPSSQVTLPMMIVEYHTDGQVCNVHGSTGIYLNDSPLILLNDMARWDLDMINQSFRVTYIESEPSFEEKNFLSKLVLDEKSVKQLILDAKALLTFLKGSGDMEPFEKTYQKDISKAWSILIGGDVEVEAHCEHSEIISAKIAPVSFVLSPSPENQIYSISNLQSHGAQISSSIDDKFTLTIPAILQKSSNLQLQSLITVSLSSIAKAQTLVELLLATTYAWMSDIFGSNNEETLPERSPFRGSVAYEIFCPGIKIDVENEQLHGSLGNICIAITNRTELSCSVISFVEPQGMVIHAQGLLVSDLKDGTLSMALSTVSDLTLPGFVKLKEPLLNVNAYYTHDNAYINVSSVTFVTLNPIHSAPSGPPTYEKSPLVSLPIALCIQAEEVIFQNESSACSVSVKKISVNMKQIDQQIIVESQDGIEVLLRSGSNAVPLIFGDTSVCVPTSVNKFELLHASCQKIVIGPSSPSCGVFQVEIPRLTLENYVIEILDDIRVTFQTFDTDILNNIQSLVHDALLLFPYQSTSGDMVFTFLIREIFVVALKQMYHLRLDSVRLLPNLVAVKAVNINLGHDTSGSLSDFELNVPSMAATIGCIETLFVANTVTLSQALYEVSIQYRNALFIQLDHPLHLVILDSVAKQPSSEVEKFGIVLPFSIQLRIQEVIALPQGQSKSFRVLKTDITIDRYIKDFLSDHVDSDAKITLSLKEVSCELFTLNSVETSFVASLNKNFETLRFFRFSMAKANVFAGFSTVDWLALIKPKEKNEVKALTVLMTPNCFLDSFDLSIQYHGKVLSSKSSMRLPPFEGDEETTSESIITHYVQSIQSRVPGFLTNLQFLGGNLVDVSVTSVAVVASGVGLGVGSVAGIALADGVRAAIESGKKSRNVDTSEGYKFGTYLVSLLYLETNVILIYF